MNELIDIEQEIPYCIAFSRTLNKAAVYDRKYRMVDEDANWLLCYKLIGKFCVNKDDFTLTRKDQRPTWLTNADECELFFLYDDGSDLTHLKRLRWYIQDLAKLHRKGG